MVKNLGWEFDIKEDCLSWGLWILGWGQGSKGVILYMWIEVGLYRVRGESIGF